MNDAFHQAVVAERDRLVSTLADIERGELINGAPVAATPETVRLIEAEVRRLAAWIAEDENVA
jgi:hypothetical protein